MAVAACLLLAGSGTAAMAQRAGTTVSPGARSAAPVVHHSNDDQPPVGPQSHASLADTNAAASASPVPSIAAFQANGGDLWTVGSAGWTDWQVGVAPGTSPAVAGLRGGGYEVAFQAYGGDLWTVGSAGWTDWHVGLAPGTNPAIAALPNGGFEVAFQGYGGDLWSVGAAGWTDWHVGLAPGTNPAIAGLPNGGYEIAFQGYGGDLWTVGAGGWTDWHVGLAPGTNPSISAVPGGGFETAFQAFGDDLWTVGTAGWTDWHVGLAARTNPAILALPGGGYETAFQANGGDLWTVGTAGWTDWGLQVAPGTSPGISAGPSGGAIEAYQGSDGSLWTVGRSGYAWQVGMAAGTNPSPLGALAAPAAAPSPSGGADNNYSFEVQNSAGTPARWNPCESLHYVVVPSGAPSGWQNDVSNDLSQLSQATGLSMVNDGTTGSVPSGYNGIVISWVSQLSGGDTVGLTTYSYYNTSGYAPQIISANIQLLRSLSGGGGMNGEQPVLLHELGHAVGLGHVNASEVMNPVDQGYSSYHAGDLNGLGQVGASKGCSGFYS